MAGTRFSRFLILLALPLLVSAPRNAHAIFGDIKRGIQHLGGEIDKSTRPARDALGNVVTLGELGRQRDAERAEAERREAAAKEEAARNEKETKKQTLEGNIRSTNEVIKDFREIKDALTGVQANFTFLSSTALSELNRRSFLRNSLFPSITSLWTNEAEYSKELLQIFSELDLTPVQEGSVDSPESRANVKQFRENANKALERLAAVSRTNEVEMGKLLKKSVAYLDLENASKLTTSIIQTEKKLESITKFIEVRIAKYEADLKSFQDQLASLN